MPAPNSNSCASEHSAESGAYTWLHGPVPDRKSNRNGNHVYSTAPPPRKQESSWAIGGYEWSRHLQFQPRMKQNGFYDQFRNSTQARKLSSVPLSARRFADQEVGSNGNKGNPDTAAVKEKSKGMARYNILNPCRGSKVPLWKRLLRKLKAKAKKIRPVRSEVFNYDTSSYEKNFDKGKWYTNPSFEASDSLRRSHSLRAQSVGQRSCDQLQRQSSAPLYDRFGKKPSHPVYVDQ